jgi:hypothetical protein
MPARPEPRRARLAGSGTIAEALTPAVLVVETVPPGVSDPETVGRGIEPDALLVVETENELREADAVPKPPLPVTNKE